jgi:hypothetical protein
VLSLWFDCLSAAVFLYSNLLLSPPLLAPLPFLIKRVAMPCCREENAGGGRGRGTRGKPSAQSNTNNAKQQQQQGRQRCCKRTKKRAKSKQRNNKQTRTTVSNNSIEKKKNEKKSWSSIVGFFFSSLKLSCRCFEWCFIFSFFVSSSPPLCCWEDLSFPLFDEGKEEKKKK